MGTPSNDVAAAGGRGRASWGLPLLVLVVALVFRAIYVAEIRELPDFGMPLVDAGYHDFWAWGMASGEWTPPPGAADPNIGETPYFRPPLPAFWLAAIFRVFGHDHLAARGVQIVLGSLTCLLAYFVCLRLFDRRTAVITGLLAATYWVLVYFDTEYREVSLLAFLYCAALLALFRYRDRPGAGRAALVGSILGLSVLAKPNGGLLALVAIAWMVRVARDAIPARTRWIHGGVLLGCVGLCVLPVTVRNWVRGDDFVLVSSNGGINLYIGNNPTSTGLSVSLPDQIPPFDSAFDYGEIVRWVEEREGRELAHSEVSAWFVDEALDHIGENLGGTLGLAFKKVLAFWSGVEIVSEKDLVASRAESTILRVVPLNFAAVFATAALGAILALGGLRRMRGDGGRSADTQGAVLALSFIAVFCLSFAPFFVTGRYRAPIVPLLLLFSGHALVSLYTVARTRRFGSVAAHVGALAALYTITWADLPGYEYDAAKASIERGAMLATQGRMGEAEQELRDALATNPEDLRARSNLGVLLWQSGRLPEAITELGRVLDAEPRDYRAHKAIGLALLQANEVERGVSHLEQAQSLRPTDPSFSIDGASALRRIGQLEAAGRFVQRALGIDDQAAKAHLELGLIFMTAGQPGRAIPSLEKATELDSTNGAAFSNLGVAYIQTERIPDAVRAFEAAARLDPQNPQVRQYLERARQMLQAGG